MKYFLDTNICIYYLKGKYPKLRDKLLAQNPDTIAITSITKAELLYGAEKSIKKKETLKKVQEFLLPFRTEGFNDEETKQYSLIRSKLEKKGTIIGPNDMLIASIVMTHGGILVTNNIKEFQRIKGLILENWIKG